MYNTFTPREYFIQYPAHPLLQVWALETIIKCGFFRRTKREGKTSHDDADSLALNHNVRSAEFEFVHWLAVNKFTEKYLRNEKLFEQMMEKCCNYNFARIDHVVEILSGFAKTLPIREQSIDDVSILEKREIEELRPIVFATYRREALDVLGSPKLWTHRQLDLYFDWFPQDEFRVPCQWAIDSLRADGSGLWGFEEIQAFGYPNSEIGYSVLEGGSDVMKGESWEEALDDSDDNEPWKK